MADRIVTAEPQDDPLSFTWQAGQAAAGLGTPAEQILGAGALAVIAYISTALTLGATVLAVFVALFLMSIGVVRLLYQLGTN